MIDAPKILGHTIKLDDVGCRRCGALAAKFVKPMLPHAARLNCANCGRFYKWIGQFELAAILKTIELFGMPDMTVHTIQHTLFAETGVTASTAPLDSDAPISNQQQETDMTATNIATTTNDGFDVQENTSSSSIIGTMMKFTEGQYRINKDQVVPIGTPLVAKAVVTAWVHWVDQKPAEHRITQPGKSHPLRDELPDQDEAAWPPGLNQEPSDPWRDTRYLHLVDQKTGADYTFITDGVGGRQGIADLKNAIANVRHAHPAALPIVALNSVPMKTKFGVRSRPQFNVVEWVGKEVDDSPF